MKVQFWLENKYYGNGSADIKASDEPMMEVEMPTLPRGGYFVINGIHFESKYEPIWHFMTPSKDNIARWEQGEVLRVELIVRPKGGSAEEKWRMDRFPWDSSHKSSVFRTTDLKDS
jgi:hypothetical protein